MDLLLFGWMRDTLGIVSLYSHAWEWTISTNGLMTIRASSAHGTRKKKKSRTKPQGQDEKEAMAGTDVEPSKTTHGEITLDLSAAAGPAVEERQEDDQEEVGQEGGHKGGGVGEGGDTG